VLSRRHPLTVEGEDIGSFELSFACGQGGRDYMVTYVERRRVGVTSRATAPLTAVELLLAGRAVPLKITASQVDGNPHELNSIARGLVSVEMIRTFADARSRSITIETANGDIATNIRLGNVGVAGHFQKLAEFCGGRETIRSTELRTVADQPR
jgi:hypothetical protein